MTPEMKAALLQMLQGGDSPAGGHADAAQDYDQICQVVEQKLAPAFEMIGKEFKALHDEVNDLKEIVYKMVTSFSDSVGSYKRQGLQTQIMGKFGPDLESLKPIYADFRGGDIVEDLLNALEGQDGDPEELVGSFLEQAKGKFGKYLGGTPAPGKDPEVEVEISTEPEVEVEAPAEEEKEEPADPVAKIMNQVSSLRGRRKTA